MTVINNGHTGENNKPLPSSTIGNRKFLVLELLSNFIFPQTFEKSIFKIYAFSFSIFFLNLLIKFSLSHILFEGLFLCACVPSEYWQSWLSISSCPLWLLIYLDFSLHLIHYLLRLSIFINHRFFSFFFFTTFEVG